MIYYIVFLSYSTNLKHLSRHTFNISRRLLALSKERVEHDYMHWMVELQLIMDMDCGMTIRVVHNWAHELNYKTPIVIPNAQHWPIIMCNKMPKDTPVGVSQKVFRASLRVKGSTGFAKHQSPDAPDMQFVRMTTLTGEEVVGWPD